jgi:hypothetical protein
LKHFFENYRGSGKFISHGVASLQRRGSFFFLTSFGGSGSFSAAMEISEVDKNF